MISIAAMLHAALAAQASEPARFTVINRGPLHALVGVPAGWTGGGADGVEVAWDMASHAVGASDDDESLRFDGETHALTLRGRFEVLPRLQAGIELPWIAHGGGFLDRPIDRWHDAFGLREGLRPSLPRDDLDLRYERDGAQPLAVDDSTSGIGDLRTGLAWRALGDATGGTRLDTLLEVKWPTGDSAKLTGSGGTDVAVGARGAGRAGDSRRLGWSLGAGVVWPGSVDDPLPGARTTVPWYDASVSWQAWEPLELVLQVQGQGRTFDTDVGVLGDDALQLGGGFLWRFAREYSLAFAILEDISVDSAPDFSAQLALRWQPAD